MNRSTLKRRKLLQLLGIGPHASGSSDPAIFTGPKGQPHWPHGWVMRLSDGDTGRGSRFRWRMVALGGLPWEGGLGFSNPDNLAFDASMCSATKAAGV